jgi:hypothetical protein
MITHVCCADDVFVQGPKHGLVLVSFAARWYRFFGQEVRMSVRAQNVCCITQELHCVSAAYSEVRCAASLFPFQWHAVSKSWK